MDDHTIVANWCHSCEMSTAVPASALERARMPVAVEVALLLSAA